MQNILKASILHPRTVIPISKCFKDVQDFLKNNVGNAMSPADIREATGVDVANDEALLQKLKASQKVRVVIEEGGSAMKLRYRPAHGDSIKDKASLLDFIRDHGTGTYRDEIEDCYKGIQADIDALIQERRIFAIHNPPDKDTLPRDAVFPTDTMGVGVDEDIVAQFHDVPIPYDVMELQAEVNKAGLRSAMGSQEFKQPAAFSGVGPDGKTIKKKRKERAINLNKVTNAHLPDLFSDLFSGGGKPPPENKGGPPAAPPAGGTESR